MIFPLFPFVREAYLHLKGKSDLKLFDYSLMSPSLAHQTGALETAFFGNVRFRSGGDGRKLRQEFLHRSPGITSPNMFGLRRLFAAEYTDPLADRRLIELCLSIPEEQFILKGEPRSLVRRVMAELLHAELLTERRRGRQSADWYEALTMARPEILQELALLEVSPIATQCLDLARMRKLVENWPQKEIAHSKVGLLYAPGLTRALSMGRFLRRVESSTDYPFI